MKLSNAKNAGKYKNDFDWFETDIEQTNDY